MSSRPILTYAYQLTDIVGSEDADKAIIDIYDIFGVASQTIQGADRLAAHASALILVPDLFEGKALDKGAIPPDTPEKQALLQEFMSGSADITSNIDKVVKIRKAIGDKWPSIEDHIGIFGLCWGVSSLIISILRFLIQSFSHILIGQDCYSGMWGGQRGQGPQVHSERNSSSRVRLFLCCYASFKPIGDFN